MTGSQSQARKLHQDDYQTVAEALTKLVLKLRANPRKAMHKHLDVPAAMVSLYEFEHAYIVGGYLIVYAIAQPWYSQALFLQELLVLRIAEQASFGIVPDFLEAQARKAGAVLAAVGTALATSDTALESLYERRGFAQQGLTLVKETH